jgi:hypothetical protein
MGQACAVVLLRRNRPDVPLPFRMWLYPIPCVIALAGWIFIFATTRKEVILCGLGSLALGVVAFFIWSRVRSPQPLRGQPSA